MIETIAHPTDFSPASSEAFAHALRLAMEFRANLDLLHVKYPDDDDACSHFAVRSGDEVIVIARTTGPGTIQYIDRAGVSRPAHATALGKVLLAALRPAQLERYLERAFLRLPNGPETTLSA